MIFGNPVKIYSGFMNARRNLESFCELHPAEKLDSNDLLSFRFAQDYAYLEILGITDPMVHNVPRSKRFSLSSYYSVTKKIESFLGKVNAGLFDEAIQEYHG